MHKRPYPVSSRCECLLLIFLALLVAACSSRNNVSHNLSRMAARPVNTMSESMLTWTPDTNRYADDGIPRHYTMVVYVDSVQCTSCFIKRLNDWDALLPMERDPQRDIRFLFIVEPKKGALETVKRYLRLSGFKHPVQIDDQSLFRKANTHIPDRALYHTFLLDKDNRVVLVGNPLQNKNIRTLFDERLQKK